MLAGRRTRYVERYLLRGRFDVERRTSTSYSCSTSTGGARDDELEAPENEEWTWQMRPRMQKMSKICAGYLVSEPSDDAGRR